MTKGAVEFTHLSGERGGGPVGVKAARLHLRLLPGVAGLAKQLHVLYRRGAALRHGDDVVELEVMLRPAAHTLPTVAPPYFATDRLRDGGAGRPLERERGGGRLEFDGELVRLTGRRLVVLFRPRNEFLPQLYRLGRGGRTRPRSSLPP